MIVWLRRGARSKEQEAWSKERGSAGNVYYNEIACPIGVIPVSSGSSLQEVQVAEGTKVTEETSAVPQVGEFVVQRSGDGELSRQGGQRPQHTLLEGAAGGDSGQGEPVSFPQQQPELGKGVGSHMMGSLLDSDSTAEVKTKHKMKEDRKRVRALAKNKNIGEDENSTAAWKDAGQHADLEA